MTTCNTRVHPPHDHEDIHRGSVCPIAVQLVVCVLQVDRLDLKELGRVVQDGEGDDGEDVAKAVAHVALLEGKADCEEPLDGNSNDGVDAAGEGDVDDREDVGGDVGQQPGEIRIREAGQGGYETRSERNISYKTPLSKNCTVFVVVAKPLMLCFY